MDGREVLLSLADIRGFDHTSSYRVVLLNISQGGEDHETQVALELQMGLYGWELVRFLEDVEGVEVFGEAAARLRE